MYAVRNKSILEGKDLLIAGGGDSALDWTNELSKIANVTLMHRRKEFRVAPDSVSKMLELEKDKKVSFLLGQIHNIEDLKNNKIKVLVKNNDEIKILKLIIYYLFWIKNGTRTNSKLGFKFNGKFN